MTAQAGAMLQGWMMGASLIAAIGAQNALVLRQGLLRQHVPLVVGVCIASDALLILAGVFGLGALITELPGLMNAFRWGGVLFLCCYGLLAGQRAWRGTSGLQAAQGEAGWRVVLLSVLAMTFLNPHVYLDTVVLLGSIGAGQAPALRAAFALGAALASLMWFSLLGFGAALMARPLQRPGVWRGLDAGIALLMFWIALQLWRQPLGVAP
ncbi:MAG: amino acid transporter [Burkholderiaceae bacterium]|nr:amino acid transporter [Roseateles sp.]MBV8469853.1 amino acid transporter [Burkholderiaceae bacterium]